jgi:hypothetical protein
MAGLCEGGFNGEDFKRAKAVLDGDGKRVHGRR